MSDQNMLIFGAVAFWWWSQQKATPPPPRRDRATVPPPASTPPSNQAKDRLLGGDNLDIVKERERTKREGKVADTIGGVAKTAIATLPQFFPRR